MKERSPKEVGNIFKGLRESKGFSLDKLAEMTDGRLTANQIDMYENGEGSLPLLGFMYMCKVLEIEDPDNILYEED